jgi:phosphoserine aminotransferase
VFAWIEEQGLQAVAERNTAKANALYDLFDGSEFWEAHALPGSRSQMNVTWRLGQRDLEATLIAQAEAAGFSGIKGHRSVGGLRASIYNACPMDSVTALVDFLSEFERSHG